MAYRRRTAARRAPARTRSYSRRRVARPRARVRSSRRRTGGQVVRLVIEQPQTALMNRAQLLEAAGLATGQGNGPKPPKF